MESSTLILLIIVIAIAIYLVRKSGGVGSGASRREALAHKRAIKQKKIELSSRIAREEAEQSGDIRELRRAERLERKAERPNRRLLKLRVAKDKEGAGNNSPHNDPHRNTSFLHQPAGKINNTPTTDKELIEKKERPTLDPGVKPESDPITEREENNLPPDPFAPKEQPAITGGGGDKRMSEDSKNPSLKRKLPSEEQEEEFMVNPPMGGKETKHRRRHRKQEATNENVVKIENIGPLEEYHVYKELGFMSDATKVLARLLDKDRDFRKEPYLSELAALYVKGKRIEKLAEFMEEYALLMNKDEAISIVRQGFKIDPSNYRLQLVSSKTLQIDPETLGAEVDPADPVK